MRVFILATATLAASILTSAPAAAQARVESIAKLCPEMTFNQVSQQIGELVQKYEFSKNPEEAEQQLAGLLCSSEENTAEAQRTDVREANIVVEANMPPQRRLPPPPPHGPHFNGPKPHFNGPHPQFSIPRLPPPPPGYGRRPAPLRQGVAVVGAYHQEQHRSMKPRPLPLTSSVRGEGYCMAATDPQRFAMERPAPHPSCQIGAIPGKPCPGWVCQRR